MLRRAAWATAAALLWCPLAQGYVRTTTERGQAAVRWTESCVVIAVDNRGTPNLTLDEIGGALARSAGNWNSPTSACGNLQVAAEPASGPEEVGADGRPILVFRNDVWQRPGAKMPYEPGILALTTVFYVDAPGDPSDGQILDTDIEVNAVNFTFTIEPSTQAPRPRTMLADLENTLTHELGHVQGLAHTCWDHITATPPRDNTGTLIPDCNGGLPDIIKATTMYPYAPNTPAGQRPETAKRHLSNDDVRGVCDVYPKSLPRAACFAHVQGGYSCAVGADRSRPGPGGVLLLVGALVVASRLQRRRRG